ncbi:MAG: prepilin-type N-terminal cleavage/methylation domain-containing protein [bacterium]|nr:prepilin-type N-terminal cleavage/methylation domain-containing protein [bacterium]
MITQIKKIRFHRFVNNITLYGKYGFTFIEVLATVVVVGIITVIAFSVYQGKRDEAKKTAAYAEMRQIAEAEKMVEMYYGYFVPLSVLNDVPGYQSDYPAVNDPDCIGNRPFNDGGGYYVIASDTTALSGQEPEYASPVRRIRDMLKGDAQKWKGPFVNYQRQVPLYDLSTGGMPIDPWGGTYRLVAYSVTKQNHREFDYRGVQIILSYSVATIEQFAIVCTGKDGWINTGDDLVYEFK